MQIHRFIRALIHRLLPCGVAFSTVLLVSCYPYPENRPAQPKPKPGTVKTTTEKTEAEKLKEKEKLAKEKKASEELKKTEAEKKLKEGETPPNTGGTVTKEQEKKPEIEKRAEYEVAKKAPGREGFVLSPYNQKLIDVRGFKSGDLVRDPTYDPSEKKYFRVP
jgi:hypothetical protein